MIKLKNGHEIEYNKDFDIFFKELLESIISESHGSAEKRQSNDTAGSDSFNEVFLQELMDNCIFVTHQLFELAKKNDEFSKFMVTGFIFNSIIMSLPTFEKQLDNEDPDTVH